MYLFNLRFFVLIAALIGGEAACTVHTATPSVHVRTPAVRVTTPPIRVSTPRVQAQVYTPAPRARVRVQNPSASVSIQASILPIAGIITLEAACDTSAPESCNGLDDNCNGQIDEGCGYSSGDIQVTLTWDTGVDLDLKVRDPHGFTVSHKKRRINSGGVLDRDSQGICMGEQGTLVENVYWGPQTTPPSGTYKANIHFSNDCMSGIKETTATLSISVGGQIIGAYQYPVRENQDVTVAEFTIP